MKTFNGILIDVHNKTITRVEVEHGLQPIYDLVKCSTFELVQIDDNNDIYVDEEGLLNLTPETKFFQIQGRPQPISGNGLIVGLDYETGDSGDTTLSLEWVKERVKFLDMFEVSMMSRFGRF